MITLEKELKNEIMTTDFYVSLSSEEETKDGMEKDIIFCIKECKRFQTDYSRFINNNKLQRFNSSTEILIDEEFYNLISEIKKYWIITNKVFDPTIIDSLELEGYINSKTHWESGIEMPNSINVASKSRFSPPRHNLDEIHIQQIDNESYLVMKPENLRLDLGGIGKSFIVRKLANYLKNKYTHFCISLGGDAYFGGEDLANKYPYWAIEIEDPGTAIFKQEMPVLTLKNIATATSGINKRNWLQNGVKKNHIINPITSESINNNVICVTVIGEDLVYCDIFAKTLLIMGIESGMEFSENNTIASIFFSKNGEIIISGNARNYVWKE